MDFADALPLILKYEGGKVDDPKDRGGRTAFGVTQKEYDTCRTKWGQPIQDVWLVSLLEVSRIYREEYWTAAGCETLEWPISLCQFDAAVQHGVKNATILLQRAVGVSEDGELGQGTLAAVQAVDRGRVVRQMLRKRRWYYLRIVMARPDQLKFLLGWMLRVEQLNDRCVTDYAEAA